MNTITPVNLPRNRGILTACLVILAWVSVLIVLLTRPVTDFGLGIVPAIMLMTFLYTGLFITAHDAMHHSIVTGNPRINTWFGRIAVIFYAAFSYKRLLTRHSLHHKYPASDQDPDFHAPGHSGFWAWYFRFMLQYVTAVQILLMALIFNALHYLLEIPVVNLLLFWVTPALLSTLQLFYFGTFLPHKERPNGYPDRHRAFSNAYPVLWSFFACYHFGYHWEHHQYPFMPWWSLPAVRKAGSGLEQ